MKVFLRNIILLCAVAVSSISAKGLYEIVIANNTTKPLQFSMRLAGLTNKFKGKVKNNKGQPVMPGDSISFDTSYLLLADTFGNGGLVVTFKEGRKTIHKRYPIPVAQTGKDWIFAVTGTDNSNIPVNPFVDDWKICGSWANTRLQNQATLGSEIAGIAVGVAAVVVGGAVIAPEVLPGIVVALTPTGSAFEALSGGSVMLIGGSAAAAASVATIGGAIGGTYKKAKKAFGLSRKMHKDKCVKYTHKRKKK